MIPLPRTRGAAAEGDVLARVQPRADERADADGEQHAVTSGRMFDKRDLDLAVREQLRPVLRRAGFSRFERRNGWRIAPQAIDIVSVQLTREAVDEDGYICPSRTFFVLMACCPRLGWPAKKNERTGEMVPTKLPNGYHCSMRNSYGWDVPRPNVQWEIARDGSNLPRLIKAMIEHVVIDGLPWFAARHAEISAFCGPHPHHALPPP